MLQHVAAEPVDELEVDGEVEALELTTQVRLDLAHRVIEPTRRHQHAWADRGRQLAEHGVEVLEREGDPHEPGGGGGQQELPDAGVDRPVGDVDQSLAGRAVDESVVQPGRDRWECGGACDHEGSSSIRVRSLPMPSAALRRVADSLMPINRATSA